MRGFSWLFGGKNPEEPGCAEEGEVAYVRIPLDEYKTLLGNQKKPRKKRSLIEDLKKMDKLVNGETNNG